MSTLLDGLLGILGHDVSDSPVNLTGVLTGTAVAHPPPERTNSNLAGAAVDRLDRVDRQPEIETSVRERGRFKVGGVYSTQTVERVHPLRPEDRAATDAAGFPRASAVRVEGVGLLVADVARLLVDGRFMVLGFVDLPAPAPQPRSPNRSKR